MIESIAESVFWFLMDLGSVTMIGLMLLGFLRWVGGPLRP